VVRDATEREAGEQFLAEWAADHGIDDATRVVDDTGDIERAIAREARDNSLLLLGATERGLLSRLVHDSLNLSVVDEVDCSVLLAERARPRSLRERLFGGR
jgi:nucleotide-binding universal stress UspA family protein